MKNLAFTVQEFTDHMQIVLYSDEYKSSVLHIYNVDFSEESWHDFLDHARNNFPCDGVTFLDAVVLQ